MCRSPFKTKAQKVYVKPERSYPPVPEVPPVPRGVMWAANDAVKPVPKLVKAKPGKRAPTVAEAKWLDAITAYGCVACRMDGHEPRPTAVHHLLRGGQRIGHLFSLPLCDPGHHQNGRALGLVSRHPFKARFEAKYGTEMDLLARLKVELGFYDGWKAA